jgi:protein-disulfide isomerase
MEQEPKKRDYLLPVSILIAAVLVSGALVYNVGKKSGGDSGSEITTGMRSISADDHIFGNSNAPVKVVVFSDLECSFCKNFHLTMKQVVATYGNQVAWVFRHFPLDSIHRKARKEAEAAECAAELGGPPSSEASNEKFWLYIDRVFEITPANVGLDLALLPQLAVDVGLDRAKFEECLNGGRTASRVQRDVEDALNSGARGTPYSIVINEKTGKKDVIPGALPFQDNNLPTDVKRIIQSVL